MHSLCRHLLPYIIGRRAAGHKIASVTHLDNVKTILKAFEAFVKFNMISVVIRPSEK